MMVYDRSDIILVNLYPKKWDEVGKIRPCVVLSDATSNQELETLIVLPLSTQLIDNVFPYRVRLTKRKGIESNSDVLIHQIRTISKKRVLNKISNITQSEYEIIKEALCQNI